VSVIKSIESGMNEKTIIRNDRYKCKTFTKHGVNADERLTGDRCVNVINSITQGMNEKTIIPESRDHYDTIHPTQKPISLLKRLLNLTTQKGDLVIDTFAGSCSTGIAASQLERQFMGWEIDEEYYLKAVERIKSNVVQMSLF
jgi:site-specific DNA-methyltransferase (adenine-specific)